MLIGDVARRSGVPTKTLRYYEQIGLLEAPARSASGYRQYEPDVLARLGFIKSAQALGLTLGEIRSVIRMREAGDAPCGHVVALVSARVEEIDKTIRSLRALKVELRRLLDRAQELDPADCEPHRVCHLVGSPGSMRSTSTTP